MIVMGFEEQKNIIRDWVKKEKIKESENLRVTNEKNCIFLIKYKIFQALSYYYYYYLQN